MTRVLALDIAKLSGWAVGSTESGVESFGTHELPKTESWNLGEYGMAARTSFRRMLVQVRPDLVVFEAPILRSGKIKHRGNGKAFVASVDTPAKLRKIYGLPWELEIECYRTEPSTPVEEANIGEVRAHFLLGKVPRTSEECKIAVKVMCRRRGWAVRDDNEADALAILDRQLAILDPAAWQGRRVRLINAGESALMSSSGADAFARSQAPGRAATRKAAPAASRPSSAGSACVSSTGRKSPGKTTATIRQSAGAMSSTSSGSQAKLKLNDPAASRLRTSRR